MADLATDITATVGLWSLGDFKPNMPTVSGKQALLHRLCVRLQTPRGRFPWWPNFGTNLAAFLLTKVQPTVIAGAAESECLKDEQVDDVRARVEVLANGRAIRLTLEIFSNELGPFAFSLLVEQAKLELIDLQAA
jgi:hypothetical protein